ncbi:heavy-metal-associated domain-containing protein [Cupriavidus basilensis]|uniref:heavy-metal-associated domain-containing protein n=1 Tax=Cupriavidus basilensis TaxID=68895 RepID=UPI0039F72394
MKTIELEVQGMTCGSCVNHVTHALEPIDGVSSVTVDLPTGRVRVAGDLTQGSQPLVAALSAAGYPARLVAEDGAKTAGASPARDKPSGGGCCGGQ